MPADFSRRGLFHLAAGAAALGGPFGRALGPIAFAQELATPKGLPDPVVPVTKRSAVSLVKGEVRRKNVTEALVRIDDQIRPMLKLKKYVVIKPNNVATNIQLAATHVDALEGILDYLEPRFKGPVVIAESSAGNTMEGFEYYKYTRLPSERRSQKIQLIDLNEEAKFEPLAVLSKDLHVDRVRLAARLLDPDAFIICSTMLKTHNVAVATLSVKNMTLGAPLHNAPKEAKRWNDKRKYHTGVRGTNYNMMLTAQKMAPFWGATVIDGFEGMEGNGPSSGTPVASRIAIASTDYIAADRVGVECMGINPLWVAHLQYCWQAGLGQYEADKIDIRGEKIADVQKKYRLHADIERELRWIGPLEEPIEPPLG
ncbi:MAG: DUF362 domain-containing protein [Acidobacteriota bacterium]